MHAEHATHGGGHDDHAHHVGSMQHDFSDVARFEAMFESPDRAGWQRPVEVVAMLELEQGQTVVDLGTGTGYFLPFLSVAVGPRGYVIALDTESAMIDHVRARAEREGIANVEAHVVGPDDPGLANESVDRVLVVNTWHHLSERGAYAARLRAALRPGGAIVVVDFTAEASQGPPVSERIAPETVAVELAGAGLVTAVLDERLPDQYVVRGRLP